MQTCDPLIVVVAKGPDKRGHIVADTLFLMMFLARANARDKMNVVFLRCAN